MRDLIKNNLGGTVQRSLAELWSKQRRISLPFGLNRMHSRRKNLNYPWTSSVQSGSPLSSRATMRYGSSCQNSFWGPPMANRNYLSPWVDVHWVRRNSIESRHHDRSDQSAAKEQRYASASEFGLQVCFSKSSCASRLKASAATVLSRRGVVIPHVQREQHQPLKSSPLIEMRCLFMCVYLLLEL